MIRKLLVALAATVAFASYAEADVWMCGPVSDQIGARTAVNPTTSPSTAAVVYQLNARGCGMIRGADVGWFLSQGFVVSSSGGAVSVGPLVNLSATPSVTLPPRSYIENIVVYNGGPGNVTSNGIKIGTTSGGSDIVELISASAFDTSVALQTTPFVMVAGSPPTSRALSPTAVISPGKRLFPNGTQVYVDTAGAWGSATSTASVTVTIFYSTF